MRIEALANLDKALFSLCSQLSYVNQIDNIHQLILQTEKVASTAFNQLVDFIPQAQNKEEK